MRSPLAAALVALALAAGAAGPDGPDDPGPTRPGPGDKCPVCGMFVARYPEWVATVRWADGGQSVFDGPKDLLKFLLDVKHYAPGRRREDVRAIFVSDYYEVEPVKAEAAFFVLGSDVYGPMGRELIPFASARAAEEFRRDHHGTRVLRWAEVTPAVLKELD